MRSRCDRWRRGGANERAQRTAAAISIAVLLAGCANEPDPSDSSARATANRFVDAVVKGQPEIAADMSINDAWMRDGARDLVTSLRSNGINWRSKGSFEDGKYFYSLRGTKEHFGTRITVRGKLRLWLVREGSRWAVAKHDYRARFRADPRPGDES